MKKSDLRKLINTVSESGIVFWNRKTATLCNGHWLIRFVDGAERMLPDAIKTSKGVLFFDRDASHISKNERTPPDESAIEKIWPEESELKKASFKICKRKTGNYKELLKINNGNALYRIEYKSDKKTEEVFVSAECLDMISNALGISIDSFSEIKAVDNLSPVLFVCGMAKVLIMPVRV